MALKGCSTVQKIVTKIVIEFFRTNSARSEKFWLKSAKKINHRTNSAIFYATGSIAQKIGRAAQADFFWEVGGAYEYLCNARAVHDVITSTCLLLRRS